MKEHASNRPSGNHRNPPFKRRKSFQFTLIELLITITIIAILAAMLLPALNHARERGHAISCTNNYKTCYLATLGYANDHNDYFVPRKGVNDFFIYNLLSEYVAQPIVGNGASPSKPFICPKKYFNPYYSACTGVSAWVPIDSEMWVSAIKLGSVGRPSRCFMGLEISRRVSGSTTYGRYYWYEHNAFAHNNHINVVHFDGHVSQYKDESPYFYHLSAAESASNTAAGPYWNPAIRQ